MYLKGIIMTEKFIEINGQILDYNKHKEDFHRYSRIIGIDLKEYFKQLGFVMDKNNSKEFLQKLKFCNSSLDMEVGVVIKKRNKISFV